MIMKKIFKSNYMLDEYQDLFNNKSIKLGKINIDRNFNVTKKSLEDASKEYYKNIDHDKIKLQKII